MTMFIEGVAESVPYCVNLTQVMPDQSTHIKEGQDVHDKVIPGSCCMPHRRKWSSESQSLGKPVETTPYI